MPAAVGVAVAWFGVVVVIGAIAVAMTGSGRARTSTATNATTSTGDGMARSSRSGWSSRVGWFGGPGLLSRLGGALVVLVVGTVATMAACFVVGKIAHALQNRVDWPFFRWWRHRHVSDWAGIEWSHLWRDLTSIGSPVLTQDITLIAGLALALMWCRRRWWAPPLVLGLGYLIEKYGQIFLKHSVHRGHPPTTLGTFPSGGCARVLVIYGLVIFLTLRWWGPVTRRPWAAGGLLLALLLSIQAYARIYNLEHWLTDVIGGVIYGLLLLTMMITVFEILVRDRQPALAARQPTTG